MFMRKFCVFIVSMICLLSLTACQSPMPLIHSTQNGVNDVQSQICASKQDYSTLPSQTPPSAIMGPTTWLSHPAWMTQHISMHGQQMPFSFVVGKILDPTGANVSYQDGLDQNLLVSMNYTGTVAGALDKLAAMSGYAYDVQNNTVTWTAYQTKTFDVSFMPGASQYLMGDQANTNNASSQYSNNASVTMTGQTMTSQYSNLQGTLSVWSDLEHTIHTMLSKDGQVFVSQATTTITVRDHPQNVRLISEYLNSMNRDLSRQVALQVQVLQITLNKAFSYGINWDLVSKSLSVLGGVGSAGAESGGVTTSLGADLTSLGGIGATGIGVGLIPHNASQAFLNAIQQQGTVTTVTQPRVVTLNNQVAQIAITSQKTYLASITTTNTINVGTQTSLTPGEVTTGFTMYVLPKIIGQDVYLQLTSELSNLDSLDTFSSSSGSTLSSVIGESGSSQIEGPTVSSKSFNQRTMVPSGQSLILSGFRQVGNENNQSSLYGIGPLGGLGAQQNDTEVLVIITPIIVGANC